MRKFLASVWFPYVLVILVSFIPLVSIFSTPLLFHSHDGLVHLPRITAYYKALRDGEFPVRWAGDLNYGYGMPLFNFMYQTPYAIGAALLFLGFHLVTAFKVSLSLSFLLSGIFMFAFAKELFGDNKKAFLITVLYQYAPFRLVELLVRGSFGEVYTYACIPLVLFGIVKLSKKVSFGNILLTSVATFLLILSHNALSLVFFLFAAGFFLFCTSSLRAVIWSGMSLLGGLLLAAFYWVPAIFEHKYTYGDLFMTHLYESHFPPLQNFFIPNFTNAAELRDGGISVQIGLFQTLAVILALILFLKKSKHTSIKKLLLYNVIVLLITFFFMQPISKILWQHIALLRQFQFPWRLLGLVALSTSLLGISFFYFKFFTKQVVYYALIILIVGTTFFYWRPMLGYDKINEAYYWNFPLTTTYYGETDVIWSAGPAKAYPKNHITFIAGSGQVTNFTKKTTLQTFTVTATTPATLVSNTEYFPGWKVYVNNQLTPIQFQDPNYRGLITFPVPAGRNMVTIRFTETPLRLGADILSVVGIICLIGLGLGKKWYEEKRN